MFRRLRSIAIGSAGLAAVVAALLCATPVAAQSSAAPLETTDETGRHVAIPQPVRRIVSLAPSITETLYAIGAQDRLVGVTDYSDYPPEAKQKTNIGGSINPNLEQLVALKPDLVVATRALNRRETVDALARLGFAVYATDERTVEGVLVSTERLADVIGAHERGAELVAGLRQRLAELKRALEGRAPRRVLFVVWHDPLISIGRETFLADALRRAGAESVVNSSQDWPRLSLEEVVRLQPEYLVFADSHAEQGALNFEALRERPGWRNLDAVRAKRIAIISDAIDRPCPRLVDAIEQLARQLHPEAFADKPAAPAECASCAR